MGGSVHFHVSQFRILFHYFLQILTYRSNKISSFFLLYQIFLILSNFLARGCLIKLPKTNKLNVRFCSHAEFIEWKVNWPQPWHPLHAPKSLWSRLLEAKVGHNGPRQNKAGLSGPKRPKWDDTGPSVLFEKRMLHLWLVALCVHVVMWSFIRPSSHRYHGNSATHLSLVGGSEPVCLLFGTHGLLFYSLVLLMVFLVVDSSCSILSLCGSHWL